MKNIESSTGSGKLYKDLENVVIDHIANDGGTKYGKTVDIYFKNGICLRLRAMVDIGSYGVHPQIERQLSKWGRIGESTKPIIICLCGSTKFYDLYKKWNYTFTLANKIVLSIGCDTKLDEGLKLEDYQKKELDELHLRKIDLADEVFIINKDGYIGNSTKREIEYAKKHNKIIIYLEEK